jgi:hypothetical protein
MSKAMIWQKLSPKTSESQKHPSPQSTHTMNSKLHPLINLPDWSSKIKLTADCLRIQTSEKPQKNQKAQIQLLTKQISWKKRSSKIRFQSWMKFTKCPASKKNTPKKIKWTAQLSTTSLWFQQPWSNSNF